MFHLIYLKRRALVMHIKAKTIAPKAWEQNEQNT